MSKRAIDAVFEGLFLLTDIRVMLRETAPFHELDDVQKQRVSDLLKNLEKQAQVIREELFP
jgi:hypothetical protein